MNLFALQQDFRHWLVAEPADAPARFGEDARAGLGVYLNNYRSQLLSCLATSYPLVREWLGAAAFDAAAATHIERSPPHAWSLDAYAESFPATLECLHGSCRELVDLARLELAFVTAFVGPDAGPFDASTAADIDWDAAVLHLVPTFAWVPVTTNAVELWTAIHERWERPAVSPLPAGATVIAWRREFSPMFRVVTAEEAGVLRQVQAGATFGGICAALVGRHGEMQGPAIAGSLLGQWLAEGLVARVTRSGK